MLPDPGSLTKVSLGLTGVALKISKVWTFTFVAGCCLTPVDRLPRGESPSRVGLWSAEASVTVGGMRPGSTDSFRFERPGSREGPGRSSKAPFEERRPFLNSITPLKGLTKPLNARLFYKQQIFHICITLARPRIGLSTVITFCSC